MKIRIAIISCAIGLSCFFNGLAQSASNSLIDYPKVGQAMPYFKIEDVTHYYKRQITLDNFKGKWLFLDFWFPGCLSCIQSFPKIDKLQKEFKNEAQFVLVGNKFQYKNIKEIYEKLTLKQNINIASAYDSSLFRRWKIYAMPYIIAVDPSGKVRFKTDGRDMTVEKVRDLLAGKDVSFYAIDNTKIQFEEKTFSSETVGDNLIYRSLLAKWNGEDQYVCNIEDYVKLNGNRPGFKLSAVPLEFLYSFAYWGVWRVQPYDSRFGKVYPRILLELKDSTLFQYNFNNKIGIYNYSLTFPPFQNEVESIMKMIQHDLHNAFGYEASVEIRSMPVWELRITDPSLAAKLKSDGSITEFDPRPTGLTIKNFNVEKLVDALRYYIGGSDKAPFFDASGITHNINISLDAYMLDWSDVMKALNQNGLCLVKGRRDMKVLVLKDR
jgi:thiol-disulfide isomerase/thioredoxin